MNLTNETIARSLPEFIVGLSLFVTIIITTVVGNSLVIISIFTYRPLKKVQNLLIISLAVVDFAVAILVMPYHVVQFTGNYEFSFEFCQAWVTFDILLCTCSILNLCAIALDRFWAIHDPFNYANRRTKNLVLLMIFVIWAASALISVPPLFGWNDWSGLSGRCQYSSETGFVIFSALGSFFIPLMLMTTVYARIYCAARERLRRRLLSRSGSARSNISRGTSVRKTSVKKKKSSTASIAGGLTPLELMTALRQIDRDSDTVEKEVDNDNTMETANTLMSPEILAVGLPGHSIEVQPHVVSPTLARSVTRKFHELRYKPQPPIVAPSLIQSANRLLANGPVARRASGRRSKHGRKSEKKRAAVKRTGSEASVSTHETMTTYFKEREKISITKEKRAAKTLAIIMGAFVLCWLPFFVLYLIRPLCQRCAIPVKLFEAANWLGYVNSCLNPIIYTIFNTEFRNAFQRIFRVCSLHRLGKLCKK